MAEHSGYKISGYKAGVNGGDPNWNITFDETDFQSFAGAAYLEGPFSLIIDIDASLTAYPTYYGIELLTTDRSINITDAPQVAFIPRGERKTITPGSVPQLASIRGVIRAITIHCFGFASFDAPKVKISIRIGPEAPLTAPMVPIGRSSMVNEPAVFFGSGGLGNLIVGAGVATNLFTFAINASTGIRMRFKSIYIGLDPTPSYYGDLSAYLKVVNSVAQTLTLARIFSLQDRCVEWIYPMPLILDVNYTLLIDVQNDNAAVSYRARYNILYEEIY